MTTAHIGPGMARGQQASRAADIRVRAADRLGEIERERWDALVGPDNFYNSHRWLRSLHHAHGDDVVVTASLDGVLLGALPTWPGEKNAPGLFCLPDMFEGLRGRWPPGYLWLGARRSVYNELVCVRGPLRRPTVTALVKGALEVARSQGAAGLVLPYMAAHDARELAGADPRARLLLHDADANMDVLAGGFEAHLARMRQADRTRRRAELRACERAGTVIEWLPMAEEATYVAANLITQNRARHGGTADPGWMRRSFAAQRRCGVLDQAVGCFAVRDGRPVAVTVCYVHHDRLHARYYGFDYRNAEPAGEYFALTYRAPLDYAAAHGLRRYRLAVSAWRLKARRGAVLSPLAAVVVPLNHELCTPERAAAFNRAVTRMWRERCATRPHALAPEWDIWDATPSSPR